MDRPVLLTGGTGFLGSHITERLAAQRVPVRALVRERSDVRHLRSVEGVSLVPGTLDDRDSLRRAVDGVRGIIHAAGLIKALRPADFFRVNDEGTARLLDAARDGAPELERFVHVSSLAVRGPSADGRPLPPTAPSRPVTAYGRSKLAAEGRVLEFSDQLSTVILRPSVVHGPRDRETLAFFKAVKAGVLPLTGSPRSVISMIFAADCADACVRALDAPTESGAAFDLEDGVPETLDVIVGHIERAVGAKVRIRIPIPGALLWSAAAATEAVGRVARRPVMLTRDKVRELRAPHWVCDAAPAREALGWRPQVPFSEGARRSAAWYREAGWI